MIDFLLNILTIVLSICLIFIFGSGFLYLFVAIIFLILTLLPFFLVGILLYWIIEQTKTS